MPITGSGTLTPITTTPTGPSVGHVLPSILQPDIELAVTLDRYQELMRLPIAAFNGLNKPDENPVYACSTIWKKSERDAVLLALHQAEEMREEELGYHIAPKYEVMDNLEYASPIILPVNKHLIKLGKKTVVDIQDGYVLNLGVESAPNDPVILTVATTVTDIGEIFVYYPNEDYKITPYSISISAGVATIKIPRSRLVKPELQDDREDPLDYYENDNFLATVDIKRIYYDPATMFEYVWLSDCNTCTLSTLTTTTQNAYARISDHRLAIIYHEPTSYAGGVWTRVSMAQCNIPDYVIAYTLSGRQSSTITEMQTIRLAHTVMVNKPVSCPTVHQMWQEDIQPVPNMWTPYGNSAGAVQAWIADARQKVGQGGKFPSLRVY